MPSRAAVNGTVGNPTPWAEGIPYSAQLESAPGGPGDSKPTASLTSLDLCQEIRLRLERKGHLWE